jgi:hypothetical protein
MATFPKITGPCPYKLPLSALLDSRKGRERSGG